MIEIILGIVCSVAGLVLGSGAAVRVVSLGGLEFGAGFFLVSLGAVLLAHGIFRRVKEGSEGNGYQIRRHGLMAATVLGALALIGAGTGLFAKLTVSGMDIGYHIAAEGIPLLLLMLFIGFQRKQNALESDAISANQDKTRAVQEDLHGY